MSETWTPITGYDTGDYTDTMVFEVDYDTKKLEKISGQTLVAGEENSQYIRFTMPRFWGRHQHFRQEHQSGVSAY